MGCSCSQLTTTLDETGTDGYLMDTNGEDSNQYYLSGFDAMGSFRHTVH